MDVPHQIEPELRSPAPRRVSPRPKTTGQKIQRKLAAGIGLLFLIACIGGVFSLVRDTGLALFGRQAAAQIMRQAGAEGNEAEAVAADYTFQAGNALYRVHYAAPQPEEVTPGAESHVPPTVIVNYISFLPGLNEVSPAFEQKSIGKRLFVLLFELGVCAVVFLFVYVIFVTPLVIRSLYSNGDIAVGRIAKRKVDRNEDVTYSLHYEFSPDRFSSPRTISGKVSVTKEEYERASVGDELTVLYNPRRPRQNVSYLHGGYQVL